MAKIVKVEDVKSTRRGRVAKRNPEVLAAMAALKPGEALILSDEYGVVEEDEKSRVYQNVRAHWSDVREDACVVKFDTEGHVVVTAKDKKEKKTAK